MSKANLDERQLLKRNKAGNQSFILLAFLLLADMGLHNYGIEWLKYPLSNYVIFMIGVGSYLVRLIWNGSYVGPGREGVTANSRSVAVIFLAILIAVCIIIAACISPSPITPDGSASGNAILIISAAVGVVILSLVYWIRRRNNRDEA